MTYYYDGLYTENAIHNKINTSVNECFCSRVVPQVEFGMHEENAVIGLSQILFPVFIAVVQEPLGSVTND